jgi:peptide-methionine (S)-S-oxide reductase
MLFRYLFLFTFSLTLFSLKSINKNKKSTEIMDESNTSLEIATLGNGCFWCTEAVFESLKGVHKVTSGYSGGTTKNPTYKEVCSGTTGHAEVIQIEFDPKVIHYETLVKVFFDTHDPTTLNRQGNDIGTQYRSVIFYHNENQKIVANRIMRALTTSLVYSKPLVTEVTAFSIFYPAENYHQEYYKLHGHEPYCSVVIAPKMEKFRKKYKDYLK